LAAPINPKGAKSDKIWRDAIMRAVRRLETDEPPKDAKPQQRLERLADALVAKGLEGDVPAMKEIGDRLDGKPHQTAEITHVRQRAADLSDDELAGYIEAGSGEGAAETPSNPSQLN
jgi:hypothetical protein